MTITTKEIQKLNNNKRNTEMKNNTKKRERDQMSGRRNEGNEGQ